LPRSNVCSTPDLENPSASVHLKRFSTPSLTLKFLCAGKLNPRGLLDTKFAVRRRINRLFRRLPDPELAVVNLIPKDMPGVFLDVGANRGQTIDGLRQLRPDIVIHAFEPNRRLAEKLERQFLDDQGVVVHAIGLSDKAETRELFLPHYKGFMYDGLASFEEQSARAWLAEGRIIAFDPKQLKIERLACTTVTLDSLKLEPIFIKLDVQEHEIHVLRGGEETIRRHQPIFMIEAPRDDLETAFLHRVGYERCGWASGRLVRGVGRLQNNLFVPREKLDAHGFRIYPENPGQIT
jgi:FkbM family methyltransferase